MKTWRLAKSLETLRAQINGKWPKRNKSEDGTIGDTRHQNLRSEHNPDRNGVVRAFDCTNDPTTGPVSDALARNLIRSRDPRILYVISNGHIASSVKSPWNWRPYDGDNPHDKHFHISVVEFGTLYDNTEKWDFISGDTTIVTPKTYRTNGVVMTEFGGDGDEQLSAYGGTIHPEQIGFSLPFHFDGARPKLQVFRPSNGDSVSGYVVDVGPWFPSHRGPSDPYWITGTRPRAEKLAGSNFAGIDATRQVFDLLGVPGKPGTRTTVVDWEIVR